jgi:hypothetical protein
MVIRALCTFIVVGVVGCGFDTPIPPETLPKVFFATDQSLTDETIESAPILLKLSMKSSDPVTVQYEASGGSATVGRDVNNTEGEVTFAPFQDTATIVLGIANDGIEEEEEDVRITLRSAENAELGEQIDHRLRISANKLPRVRFVNATSAAGEETGTQSFAVQLDTLAAEDVVVRYSWAGTAEPADHGVTESGILTIRAGQSSQPIPAPITNDPTDEDDETIELSLIAQAGAVVAPGLGLHVHTIIDDDLPPVIGFTTAASTVAEGVGTATLTVSLELASEKLSTIEYAAAAGGSATAEDFTLAAGTLTFPPGTTSLTVPVAITNDLLDEDSETVRVSLRNASNARLGAPGDLHTLTITDDDAPPSIEFQQAASSAGEAAGTHAVTVALSAPSGKTVQFQVSRTGTATEADATLPVTAFSIPPGGTTATVNVTIVNDAIDEDNETVVLTLTGLVNAGAGPQGSHTITIVDDDEPPLVRFDPATPDRTESEANQTYVYRVVLSAASSKPVTVNVTVGGTAMNNDYDIGTNDIPVVFAPGQAQKDIRVTISQDNAPEADETITLTLGSATNATNAGDNQTRTHTIQNDDGALRSSGPSSVQSSVQ